MDKLKPKSRKQLNNLQKEILLILYKFRFATAELIVAYQERESSRYTNIRLRILLEQAYIGRNYDGMYRIDRKRANYYLLKQGIHWLKDNTELNPTALNGMYKDDRVKEQFIDRCLIIFKLYNKFHALYGQSLSFYTKSEITQYDFFPRPLPDAYLKLKAKDHTSEFMLEIVEAGTPLFAIKKRVKQYIEHVESGDWDETGSDYPTLLLLCENQSVERSIQKRAASLLDGSDADELVIYTTTMKALMGVNSSKDEIWSDVLEPENLLSL